MQERQKKILDVLDKSGAGLYALLTRLTLHEDVAEDLMQELFIKLSNARELNHIDNWSAYAHRAAINLAFDWRRRQKRMATVVNDLRDPTGNSNSPLTELIQSEQLQQLLNAIGRLKGFSREAFVLRYIEQDSYEEIAEKIGKNPHQVRALCSKALGKLRGLLEADQSGSCRKEVLDVET